MRSAGCAASPAARFVVLLAPALVGCKVMEAGAGVTVAVTQKQVAVGPTLDFTSVHHGVDDPLQRNKFGLGGRLEGGALFPAWRLDPSERLTPQLHSSVGLVLAPTTFSALMTGISYRGGWWTNERTGVWLGGLGALPIEDVRLRSGIAHRIAVFGTLRLTLPFIERLDGYGWEIAASVGLNRYWVIAGQDL